MTYASTELTKTDINLFRNANNCGILYSPETRTCRVELEQRTGVPRHTLQICGDVFLYTNKDKDIKNAYAPIVACRFSQKYQTFVQSLRAGDELEFLFIVGAQGHQVLRDAGFETFELQAKVKRGKKWRTYALDFEVSSMANPCKMVQFKEKEIA